MINTSEIMFFTSVFVVFIFAPTAKGNKSTDLGIDFFLLRALD